MEINAIARIESVYGSKFGIPRQSNVVECAEAAIVFEPRYRVRESLVGIEGFDYLWLLWRFSETEQREWSPTVRPPRLGGNRRVGVFASRSPFRPNAIGLSSVRLIGVDYECSDAPRLIVGGADLLDGTPIIDIKPYIPYTDAHADARSGFAPEPSSSLLKVEASNHLIEQTDQSVWAVVRDVLAHDPRPAYQHDNERVYGMKIADHDIRFRVVDDAVAVVEEIVFPFNATKRNMDVSL